MDRKKKIKHSPEYISYVESGESAAVFVIRDIVKRILTSGKWIDVLRHDGIKSRKHHGKWNFSYIIVELFPRRTHPHYPEHASEEERKFITWETAQKDIAAQRKNGYVGKKFRVNLELYNMNEGKTRIERKVWNKRFEEYVPEKWMNEYCEYRDVEVPVKPRWGYRIISVQTL